MSHKDEVETKVREMRRKTRRKYSAVLAARKEDKPMSSTRIEGLVLNLNWLTGQKGSICGLELSLRGNSGYFCHKLQGIRPATKKR